VKLDQFQTNKNQFALVVQMDIINRVLVNLHAYTVEQINNQSVSTKNV
jgi:hypothetical protein